MDATSSAAAAAREPSPRRHVDGDGASPLPTDSMVTVSLSEGEHDPENDSDATATGVSKPAITVESSSDMSSEITTHTVESEAKEVKEQEKRDSKASIRTMAASKEVEQDKRRSRARDSKLTTSTPDRPRSDSEGSNDDNVDWDQLDKTEGVERVERGEQSDESTALLLARLEQENNAIATDPKSGIKARARSQSRPPSMNQLKKMVEDQNAPARLSLLPSPPPMTELEFWAALVRDYPQTAQRLPTLTSNKIRGGIPAPLRGVTWLSMAGARDRVIEEQYDRLCGESSPYENMIGKDIGRSFPGVEMFRDPEGEGQKMLGRVLKCFSLYDEKIGYCQGLGFLVGPLLMQMGDREAFCLLVRLMEDYDLRSCFLPDLSGLHLRIYQFQRLLHQLMPKLAQHLDSMQIEAAYLSQWFLSFFAVTCPLPMLFRIYDVIFAEGASETIMRVALSIMRRNEKRLLAYTEFEDAMQLLLSRALWDPYGCNAQSADDLVNDFVSFTNVVTREKLQSLEAGFREAQNDEGATKSGFFPEVQNAASRFLGRLWAPNDRANRQTTQTLSPPTAPSRPVSFLRRSPSKQSIASTLNSVEASSDGTHSHASTAMTEVTQASRESSTDNFSLKSMRNTVSNKDKDLHGQIEDLLTALSEMQREHAQLAAQLEKEREERREDHRVVRSLVDRVKKDKTPLTPATKESRRRTAPAQPKSSSTPTKPSRLSQSPLSPTSIASPTSPSTTPPLPQDLLGLVDTIDTRFPRESHHHRNASVFETKAHLRDSLARTKEQLHLETTRTTAISRQLLDAQTESSSLRNQLEEARHRLQDSYQERQRLEKVIQDLKLRNSSSGGGMMGNRKTSWNTTSPSDTSSPSDGIAPVIPTLTRSDTAESTTSTSGLREFKLSRTASGHSAKQIAKGRVAPSPNAQRVASTPNSQSTPQYSKRSSSLSAQTILTSTEDHKPMEADALLLELVNSKTSEAVARQELEELKGKFESLRKLLGVVGNGNGAGNGGGGGGVNGSGGAAEEEGGKQRVTSTASTASFWGWGKRSVSASLAPKE
ncbi:hypothetical protein K490DRAFT_32501 [Saccharata proteae CBS 121410]|uniref:Rab-GAP TBC domain-containing protein n=1 Tax=Saccharata proteae CBS 121410 TaxID=1314787 RepID=A0A9P4I0U6_9PEZI|nr:hypothetical protein K490DRAFT_32501 [Saccharata proteae CBS 121410]